MKAGFAEVNITPPVGTLKIGWIMLLTGDRVVDPLFARVAVFESGQERAAVIQLDTLCVRWTMVNELRQRIEKAYGFPGKNILVSATHNHAGPAIATFVDTVRDETYIADLTAKVVAAFGEALKGAQAAEIGFGHGFEWRVPHNRRIVQRDGTTKTHGAFNSIEALGFEGPVDPEIAVIAVRHAKTHAPLGCIVNFTCHPTHLGGGHEFSGGYPGALARNLKAKGWPVPLFLNGACGNIHDANPRTGRGMSKNQIGRVLAADVIALLPTIEFQRRLPIEVRSRTIRLDFRTITDAEIHGKTIGAQRFVDPDAYDRGMPALLAKIKKEGKQKAEIQALFLGDHVLAAVPAEYFVEFGLRIKEEVWPRRALISATSNGMIGYLPTAAAFKRGGYETTFYGGTRLAHNAGDLLTDAMIRLIKK